MNESEKTAKINKELRKNFNCEVIKLAGSFYQQNGLPDTLIIKDGTYIWVEYKEGGNILTPLQLQIKKRLMSHGAKVFVVNFVNDKCWMIDNMFKIEFRVFREGVQLLLETLLSLSRKEGSIVS